MNSNFKIEEILFFFPLLQKHFMIIVKKNVETRAKRNKSSTVPPPKTNLTVKKHAKVFAHHPIFQLLSHPQKKYCLCYRCHQLCHEKSRAKSCYPQT